VQRARRLNNKFVVFPASRADHKQASITEHDDFHTNLQTSLALENVDVLMTSGAIQA
jgi:hypothetical protein